MIKEKSVMAVVICNNKILTIHEMIYGNLKISLPKGHLEDNETVIDCAIRETFEETNVVLKNENFIKELSSFQIRFTNLEGQEVIKLIKPILFLIQNEGEPKPKELRMVHVEYLEIQTFLIQCSYENVKKIVTEAINILANGNNLNK